MLPNLSFLRLQTDIAVAQTRSNKEKQTTPPPTPPPLTPPRTSTDGAGSSAGRTETTETDDGSVFQEETLNPTVFWNQRTRAICVFVHPLVQNRITVALGTPDSDGRELFELLSEYTIIRHFAVCARLPVLAIEYVKNVKLTPQTKMKKEKAKLIHDTIRGIARMYVEIEATKSNDQYNRNPDVLGEDYTKDITQDDIDKQIQSIEERLGSVERVYSLSAERLRVANTKFTQYAQLYYSTDSMSSNPTNRDIAEFYNTLDVTDLTWGALRPRSAHNFFAARDVRAQRFIRWWKRQLMRDIDHPTEWQDRGETTNDPSDRPSEGVDGTFYVGHYIMAGVDKKDYKTEYTNATIEHIIPRSWTRNSRLIAESEDPDELPPATVIALGMQNSARGEKPLNLGKGRESNTTEESFWPHSEGRSSTIRTVRRQIAANKTAFGTLMTPLCERDTAGNKKPNPGIPSYRDQFNEISAALTSLPATAVDDEDIEQRARWEIRFNVLMWAYFDSALNPFVDILYSGPDYSTGGRISVPDEWLWMLQRRFNGISRISVAATEEVTEKVRGFPQVSNDGIVEEDEGVVGTAVEEAESSLNATIARRQELDRQGRQQERSKRMRNSNDIVE